MQQEEDTPKERFLASQGILSTIEWVDDLQEKRACAKAMALFEMHTDIMLTGTICFIHDPCPKPMKGKSANPCYYNSTWSQLCNYHSLAFFPPWIFF